MIPIISPHDHCLVSRYVNNGPLFGSLGFLFSLMVPIRLCYISYYKRGPIISSFNYAFHAPISCSVSAHTSFSEGRDHWRKSPVHKIITDWISVNMWFKLVNKILSSENFELDSRDRVRCLNWEVMYSWGKGSCMSQILAKTEKVKGIEKAMNEAMCRESERKRDREQEGVFHYLILQFLLPVGYEDGLYFLTLGSIRHMCLFLISPFCLNKFEWGQLLFKIVTKWFITKTLARCGVKGEKFFPTKFKLREHRYLIGKCGCLLSSSVAREIACVIY